MLSPLPEFYCPYTSDCYECCLDTEMALAEKDITRIEKLGFEIDDFLKEKEGFMVLENVDGHCFFLDDKLCSIYDNRPQGCRFYPLIFDLEIDSLVIDNLCVHNDDFDPHIYKPLFDPIRTFVYNLISEKEIRVKKMKEEEELELKETLEEQLEEDSKSIEVDIKKLEEIFEETIEEATSEELEKIEGDLEEEMREIEDEISELEKGIEEELREMEDEVEELSEEIRKEFDSIEEVLDEAEEEKEKEKEE